VYVDAHADFSTPHLSQTGSAASMCLALAVGRGETQLASLGGNAPLVHPENVVLLGRRDQGKSWYGHDALRASRILDIPDSAIRKRGIADASSRALQRVTSSQVDGFWIHIDADVIDPTEVPAVDSPVPDGLRLAQLVELLAPLARHPRALGLELTIYDPKLDPDQSSAGRLSGMLQQLLLGT
jgi:arginase